MSKETINMAIVEAKNLSRVYGSGDMAVTALDAVSLSVEAGEFVAVMGPSGCGKSTLLNLIGGLDTPSSGSVMIDGRDIAGMNDTELTALRRQRIGFVFQFFNLIPVLSSVENVALPLVLDGKKADEANAAASDWLKRIGLGDRLKNRPDQLSGGQQQRVAVARALVSEPALILADEPTGNLDSRSSDEIAALLKQVSGEWGRAILMVTHDPRIAAHADRIVFMRDGRVVDDAKISGAESARAAMEKVGLL
ncbi:MAG: putative ABC transport system ATP-binding [Actinobacteria bacterium]|nr:MAG: putative ABC transport system ATP-binding [Actinomycetota bacterium]